CECVAHRLEPLSHRSFSAHSPHLELIRYKLSAATMLRRSLQPSSIIEARASRISFSIGYSRESPLPPKICRALLATSKAVFVAVTFDATARCSFGGVLVAL